MNELIEETPAGPCPAATTVIQGTKTEVELELTTKLEVERAARKKEQIRISELEDENHQLKQIPKPPAPPKLVKPKLALPTVLDDEDED